MTAFELPVMTASDLALGTWLLAPVLLVAATAAACVVVDLLMPDWVSRRPLQWIAVGGLIGSIALCAVLAGGPAGERLAFGGFLAVDSFALFFQALFLVAALLVILASTSLMNRQETVEGEFYVVTLFSTCGLMLLAAANELISIYVALELSGLSMACLASWNKNETVAAHGLKSTEAGMKFFLLSAMSSAVLLYGMALLYGLTGVTTLSDIAHILTRDLTPAVLLAVSMLVAGFGFKIAAAPFHLWTPDVYQGAPTPVTAFFSVASKAAGFAVILRLFGAALPALDVQWSNVFLALAFLTMTVGNVVALVQTNLKRLMAYSSIAHVGYMLIGLATANAQGASGVMYYLLAYAFTNLAAFIVIVVMAQSVPDDQITGYAGLGKRSPGLALALTVGLLSLAGIPPFVGFFSKLYLFLAAIARGDSALQAAVIWAVIMSALSLYYYGRVIHTMWMGEADETLPAAQATYSEGLALATSVVGVVALGIFAAPFMALAQAAANSLAR